MNKAKKIGDIGHWIMAVGAFVYMVQLIIEGTLLTYKATASKSAAVTFFERLYVETDAMTYIVLAIFVVAIVLMAIGWLGTADERKAAKAAAKAAKKA